MPVSVLSAARRLAKRSGWGLSNLELQKLLYLAHMFYLGRTGGKPLISGNFQAWDYGPVHPTLYHRAKVFGSDPVEDVFHGADILPDGPEADIIDEAYDVLGKVGPGRLVAATHQEGGAWEKNYVPGLRNRTIPDQDILDEYQGLKN